MDEEWENSQWTVELTLDNESRIWELHAIGPAGLIKHFLTDAKVSVVSKLSDEEEFDSLIPQLEEIDT